MPKVVTRFLNFTTQPATAGLLLPGVKRLAAAVPSFDSYDELCGILGDEAIRRRGLPARR
jgi:hypothetical protein